MSTSSPALATSRCQYRTSSGRRCTLPAAESGGAFCIRHATAAPNDSIDFSADLIPEGEHFQEAQQINHSLIALYKLVAAGRISSRRASVLAYVAHLILSSLKAIDYDNKTRWRRRPAGTTERPVMLTLGQMATVGRKPLPATAKEFADQVLERFPMDTGSPTPPRRQTP